MTTTEEYLGRFYIELQEWIDGGCGEHDFFIVNSPSCDLLLQWEAANEAEGVHAFARDQFRAAGLHHFHPFNADSDEFFEELDAGTAYENPARLAWIKERAEAAKAAGLEVAS